mmetsp:Transcript_4102/g.5015  ORF Transcript_4102/g.5015 Transcript_4102/m.5015 type:complete len:102 (-) Transcript_4102:85-390(-)
MLYGNKSFHQIQENNQNSVLADNEEYEKHLVTLSKTSTNRDGLKLFSLDPKHIHLYDPFYYKTMTEQMNSLKVFDEFYKTKDCDEDRARKHLTNSPFNIEN